MTEPLTAEQRRFVTAACVPGSAVMAVGGPGSGKTTALVEAVVARVESGVPLERLAVLTWSRPEAQRLRRIVVGRLGRSQLCPVITTVPGWCLGLQARYATRGEPPRLLTGPEQELQVRELLEACGPGLWPAGLRAAAGTAAFAQEVRTGLARARQNGLDPDDLMALGVHSGRPEWTSLGLFFEQYLDVLDAQNSWDYAELVHRSRLLLLDGQVHARLRQELEGLFCDEFAEYDPAQISLLEQLHRLGIALAVTADPQTSVFSFRGADPRAAADFVASFARQGAPAPMRVELHACHRGGPAIRAAVRRLLTRLPLAGGVPQAPEQLEPGAPRVVCRDHPSASAQVESVAEQLRTAHLHGMAWADQAVICRSGKGRLASIAGGLTSLGIPVEVAGDEIALSEQACVQVLLSALDVVRSLAEGARLGEEQLSFLLSSPMSGLGPTDLRRLGRRLWAEEPLAAGAGSGRIVVQFLSSAIAEATSGHPGDEPGPTPADGERDAVLALAGLLGTSVAEVRRGRAAHEILWRLWTGTGWPDRLRTEALSTGMTAAAANKDLDAICALFDLAARHVELSGPRGLRALVAEVAGQEIPGDMSRESDPRGQGVQLLTAHRTKGREWERVILVDATEGEWPGQRHGEGLLGAESIGIADPGTPPGAAAWVQKERRLFALAASRARRELLVHAVSGSGDEQGRVSRFVAEMGAQILAEQPGRPQRQTLDALVGQLRRTGADPTASVALRDEAVRRLIALAGARDAAGVPLVAAADPAQWWGTGPAGVMDDPAPVPARAAPDAPRAQLSVTALERLMQCPRCWFLDAEAGGAAPAGPAAAIGSLVHLLAEQSVTAGMGVAAMHEAVDDFWPQLAFEAGWRSEQERRATHEMVDRLEHWSGGMRGREVLGVEIPVRHELDLGTGTLVLTGTIDRLERDPASGRVWVVDFKTGANAPGRRQAARNLQLAGYQIVVADGGCSELTGAAPELGGAELVYLRVASGTRAPDMPKVIGQADPAEHPYPEGVQPGAGPSWLHDAARQALEWIVSQQYPAVQNDGCRYCAHRPGCPVWAGSRP